MISARKIRFSEYYLFTAAFFLISIISLLITHGNVLDDLIFLQGRDVFMDFCNHIYYVSREGLAHVYEQSVHACFPPLIYCLYGICGLILPEGATVTPPSESIQLKI